MNRLVLKGLAASPGSVEGVVRIARETDDLLAFEQGDVLVVHITDPTMVSAMMKASAIVTDIGGITSHPAILSREMGIPCVVNTRDATTKLANGMRVRVDGDKGEVYVA